MRVNSKIHYFIADKFGHSAVIEFNQLKNGEKAQAGITNKTKVDFVSRPEHPFGAITNSKVHSSIGQLKQFKYFGGNKDFPSNQGIYSKSSIGRFNTLMGESIELQSMTSVDHREIFDTLDKVHLGGFSKWRIVYEPNDLTVHFKFHGEEEHSSIHLDDFNLSCQNHGVFLDFRPGMTAKQYQASDFKKINHSTNLDYMKPVFVKFKNATGKSFPVSEITRISKESIENAHCQ